MTKLMLTQVEISIWALEMAVKAVGDRMQSLRMELAQNPAPSQRAQLEEELASLARAATSLRDSHEEAMWQHPPTPAASQNRWPAMHG